MADGGEWLHPASVIGTPSTGLYLSGTPLGMVALERSVPDSVGIGSRDLAVPKSSSVVSVLGPHEQPVDEQVLNDRAVSVLRRVKMKLAGSDFSDRAPKLDITTQVSRLINESRSDLNLCQLYVGWCPFW